jgi:undecaprenyl-diphosphatase
MSMWQAILLGLVQGLTEFIPISSTAHLTITGKLLGVIDPARPDEWTAFIAVIQLGTLLAVLIYFRADIFQITRAFILANLALVKRRAVAFALIPGSSRSGSTITGGLFMGLTRETAARFSFLLSIPAIAASGLLELPKALKSVQTDWGTLAVATLAAAISGYLSIEFLLRYLQRHTTFVFVGYRIALGLVIIALLVAGRISAN